MYEIFQKLMRDRGLTHKEISQATGIAQGTLTDWKMGRYTPKVDKLQKLADFFGVTLEYIQTGKMTEGYYTDSRTVMISQKLLESPGRRTLFDMTKDMPETDLQKICRFIEDYIYDDNKTDPNA